MNLAVIGKTFVGKSSLIYRKLGCYYELEHEHDPTIGDYRYSTQVIIDNKPYNIQLIETFYSEEYSECFDSEIDPGEGFLLLFAINDKDSFNFLKGKIERILKLKNGLQTPMILVGNKLDLKDDRQVEYNEAKQLANSFGIDYIEISAKKNLNCDEAIEKLTILTFRLKKKIKSKSGAPPPPII